MAEVSVARAAGGPCPPAAGDYARASAVHARAAEWAQALDAEESEVRRARESLTREVCSGRAAEGPLAEFAEGAARRLAALAEARAACMEAQKIALLVSLGWAEALALDCAAVRRLAAAGRPSPQGAAST